MPTLTVNGKPVKKFSYDDAGKKACQAAALRAGGKCTMEEGTYREDGSGKVGGGGGGY